ncbi:class I SAM-dependent methyltransferase [Sphingobacteriales bacterium UPWRP_1]|nr:hypothetical protein B6N25_13475 [Sphingobacteriales bacterium TSM_CSS]PSJ76795.1 class I SAM-dependent methyltransferase [Sphingobacteriales bacterium UPWRP_1]
MNPFGSLQWKLAQALEWRWWRQYLKGKSKPQYLQWKKQYWQGFLQQIATVLPPLNPTMRILDAGCGPAGIFTVFTQQQTVVALDPLLDQYQQKLPHFCPADYPNVQFICQPLEDYSPALPFDVVFCLNAINHVARIDQCMDNLAMATKPGGYLVLSIDAHNHPILKRLFRLVPADALHPHQYSLQEYEQLLVSRGFTMVKSLLLKQEFIFGYWALVVQKGN